LQNIYVLYIQTNILLTTAERQESKDKEVSIFQEIQEFWGERHCPSGSSYQSVTLTTQPPN